ncbi:extracellular solute-binding protein [Streptomyces sp. NPDC049881]|uniref:ABC transporter substrate-binding protein n=1 Tax=Streptomyces sp. NPDC049881 TaxID=3155778 RepID=UPI003429F301
MRRIGVLTASVAGLLTLTTAACSSGSGGGDGAGTADDPTELTFYMDKGGWNDSFEAQNEVSRAEGMVLDVVQTPGSDAAAYDSFVRQSFQTNERPDLFTWSTGEKLADLVEQGVVAETTDIWAEAEAEGLVPDGLIDNYTYDGKQYCVPLNVAYWPVYYNKHVFEEHGLEVPATFDELMDAATVLRDAGVTPFHQMNVFFEFVWFQNILAGTDPEAYAGLGTGETSFTDPVVVDAAQQWLDMMHDGYFLDPGVTTEPEALLASGDVAMASFGSFLTGELASIDSVPGEDFGVFPFPNVDPSLPNGQLVLETGPLCVARGAAHEEAALEYSRWWMDDEAQTQWSESRGDPSYNPDVPVADPEMAAVVEAVGSGDLQVQQRFQEMVPWDVYNRSKEVFGEFVSDAPDDPMDGLEALQSVADEYWSQQG